MLETVRKRINSIRSDSIEFQDLYDNYIMCIQDMDVENEILPLIKRESTEFVSYIAKLERTRKRKMKRFSVD